MKLYMHKAVSPQQGVCWVIVGYEPLSTCQLQQAWRVGVFEKDKPEAGFRFVPNPLVAEVIEAADSVNGELWGWLIRHTLALKEFPTRKALLRELGDVIENDPPALSQDVSEEVD